MNKSNKNFVCCKHTIYSMHILKIIDKNGIGKVPFFKLIC